MQVFYIYILAVKGFHLTIFRKRFKKEISDNHTLCCLPLSVIARVFPLFVIARSEATRQSHTLLPTFFIFVFVFLLKTKTLILLRGKL